MPLPDEAETRVHRPSGASATLRVALVALCALYIWGAPAAKQVFGLRHPYVRSWQMFRSEALEITQVAYYRVQPDGTRERIEGKELARAGGKQQRWPTAEAAAKTAERLCRAYGPDADVRYTLREATTGGWKTTSSGRKNACAEATK